MGCFVACFGSSKDAKRRKQRHKVLPREQRSPSYNHVQSTVSSVLQREEYDTCPVMEIRDKPEEKSSCSTPKRVTFDTNVKTYEPVEVKEILPEADEDDMKEEKLGKLGQSTSSSEESSITLSSGSYPANHRYQNCRDSYDEDEGLDYEESDIDDDEHYFSDCDEDSGDEILGSTTKISAVEVFTEEVDSSVSMDGLLNEEMKPMGLYSNAGDKSIYVNLVLNPVENLSQWKAVKATGKPPLSIQKENRESNTLNSGVSFKETLSTLKSRSGQTKSGKDEVAVDASLSNWLVSSGTTPSNETRTVTSDKSTYQGSSSLRSQEDRPILGALTVEEIRQYSATSSPRKSPCRSPDEMPIIGTVGTYWSNTRITTDSGSASSYKGIPNTSSKYREDKTVNWHSTPFEAARLERALDRDAAKAFSSHPHS